MKARKKYFPWGAGGRGGELSKENGFLGIKNIEFIIGDKKLFLGKPDLLITINEDIGS